MKYSTVFIEKQKTQLLAEKEKIESDIRKLKKYPDFGTDEEDNIQELNAYESNLIIDSEMEFLLERINKAIESIEKGTYGKCSKCGEAINQGRLEVMPWANVCVECSKDKK